MRSDRMMEYINSMQSNSSRDTETTSSTEDSPPSSLSNDDVVARNHQLGPDSTDFGGQDFEGKFCSSLSLSTNVPRTRPIPTLSEKIDFLKSLDTAATRLFHRKTGLPLTSSPAPLRKGQDRFDFDSSLVSATRITSRFRRGCHPPRWKFAKRN